MSGAYGVLDERFGRKTRETVQRPVEWVFNPQLITVGLYDDHTMSTHKTQKADKELAEATGEPREKFSAEGYEIPDFEDLETVPEDEWK